MQIWPLGCAALCLLLCIPIVHGLLAVQSLERRALFQPRSFVLAGAFHRPLYAICFLLLLLRVAFFSIIMANDADKTDLPLKMTTFWLLDLPSVAIAMLNGYIVLFAVRLVFRRCWPGATTAAASGNTRVLTAVFVSFCVSLVALVTLVAICRAQGDTLGVAVPQWMTFGYSAVIWTTLGLLMLKFKGQTVQILWRYRRRNQWNVLDGEERHKRSCQRLPVLSISCLKSLAVCSTLLAELLVMRGILCAVAASQCGENAVDVDSWRSMLLHYFSWEVAGVVIVLRMLHQTPIAVHCLNDGLRSSEKSSQQISYTPSAPAIDDGEIQVRFQMPNVRDLVADYVVPSNKSLLSARSRGVEHENAGEHRYCRVHHSDTPSNGSEYVNCRCHREDDDQFLSNANVPLLTKEYEPLTDRALDSVGAISIPTDA